MYGNNPLAVALLQAGVVVLVDKNTSPCCLSNLKEGNA
jgi:hypothetical protein